MQHPFVVRWPAVLLLTCACNAENGPTQLETPPIDPPVTHDLVWLRANAVPFDGATPGIDDADLMILKEMIGDARVVALGEATHGTREFFQMKHRIVQFLVEEMGFSTFGIEAAWGAAHDIDAYVQTREGDAQALLANLYLWPWQTEEVLAMIRWMSTHNASQPATAISFTGFDMQYSRRAMDIVREFLRRADHEAEVEAAQHYACWRVWAGVRHYRDMASSLPECRQGIHAVYNMLVARATELTRATSQSEFEHALRAARIVVQDEDVSTGVSELGPYVRDQYMAENVEWLVDRAGADGRVVLWTTNGHARNGEGVMGSHLRARYGDELVIIGFTFFQGTFNARLLSNNALGSITRFTTTAIAGSYPSYFNGVDEAQFIVDLRELRTAGPAHAAWLRGPLPIRTIGAVYDPNEPESFYTPIRIANEFDVMIHFENTHPSALLPFGDSGG